MERMKVGLVALLLIIGVNASAQLIAPGVQGALAPNLSGDGTEAIFAHESSSFKLTASTTSSAIDGVADVTFDEIKWYFKKADGGLGDLPDLELDDEPVVGGASNSELTVTGLKPGFYTFMAIGETSGDICSTVPEEFTVFVLPLLTVTVSSDLASDIYCADDLPTDNNSLTATVVFDAGTPFNTQRPDAYNNPVIGDFELRYRWYKVEDGETPDFANDTPISTSTSSNVYTLVNPGDAAVGSWNYYVAVDYTVKESGPYTDALGEVTPTVIQVTPKPGKPVITIEAL
ncbi:hypothetical protein [Sphingobacterium lumbrici]|uniref:hypothetical protein n=1 Tax=Sphingobacterium lumbrici TaxID=2559600 RepID=UPI001128AC3D|nr:hypothetical protein [Sphingobacterium lumbrici]